MTDPDGDSESGGGFTAPAVDPWRGLRGVMAGTLILEVIVIFLAFPIVAKVGGGVTWASGIFLGVLCLALILACGMQGRSRALEIDLALQVYAIVGFVFHWSIGAVGIIFLGVWLYIAYIKRDVRLRMERGLLAGQQRVDGADPPPAPPGS
ncbi:DUF4233 domain-containing protein [Williamsia sterculiae]|uniref:DUF4233 domain-containing protein n=1 Tax=Williamsia sterculiae TaxID=1344003 RepID=A0A1N7GJN5_9NOCA|nr:DUF4233 domain-containing protein [Williamsia sterculiae]SIS12805.1 Protein of unknown function [Williamsia sterculiae]